MASTQHRGCGSGRSRMHRRPAAQARRFAERTLTDWALTDRLDGVLLSELITNAVTHGPPETGAVLVQFSVNECLLRIEVCDGVTALPKRRRPANADENGRGLLVVAACADHWGVEPHSATEPSERISRSPPDRHAHSPAQRHERYERP